MHFELVGYLLETISAIESIQCRSFHQNPGLESILNNSYKLLSKVHNTSNSNRMDYTNFCNRRNGQQQQQQKKVKVNVFNSLPFELLEKVFKSDCSSSDLLNFALVDTRWSSVAIAVLWSNIELESILQVYKLSKYLVANRRKCINSYNTRSISINAIPNKHCLNSHLSGFVQDHACFIPKVCPMLQSFKTTALTLAQISTIFASCPRLTVLKVGVIDFTDFPKQNIDFESLQRGFQRLLVFKWDHLKGGKDSFTSHQYYFELFKIVSLSNCQHLELSSVDSQIAKLIVQKIDNLQTLVYTTAKFYSGQQEPEDNDAVVTLLLHSPNLKSFTLKRSMQDNPTPCDDILMIIGDKLSKLEHLRLSAIESTMTALFLMTQELGRKCWLKTFHCDYMNSNIDLKTFEVVSQNLKQVHDLELRSLEGYVVPDDIMASLRRTHQSSLQERTPQSHQSVVFK